MAVKKYNIEVDAGSDLSLSVLLRSEDAPKDLTGYTASFRVKVQPYDEEALFELTEADGITIDGAAGKILIIVSKENTSRLARDGRDCSNVYELQITSPTDWTKTILKGELVGRVGV